MSGKSALVVGGGFYGCYIAEFLAKRGFKVLLAEKEQGLMLKASYNNQARVHQGYHYPRDFVTAHRSKVNFPIFCTEFGDAIRDSFTKYYAIARYNSRVTPGQFERFCKDVGLPCTQVDAPLFDRKLIAASYLTEECVFDAAVLADIMATRLAQAGVEVRLGTPVRLSGGIAEFPGEERQFNLVVTCVYASLPEFDSEVRAKLEFTEMSLFSVPEELESTGITVMDGPFFSLMPFPDRHLHTLSHVRYTPQGLVTSETGVPSKPVSRHHLMQADASRYVPALREALYRDSLFEVKAILLQNEDNDGRPILFRKTGTPASPVFHVLGGKIDNIYDILAKMEQAGLRA